MTKRIQAKTIREVVERMRALHVDVVSIKYPINEVGAWAPIDHKIAFNHYSHEEVDHLMLDAFAILGLHEIIEARKMVEKSFDGFWYA